MRMYVYAYVHMCVCVYRMYMRAYTKIHTHTHTHTFFKHTNTHIFQTHIHTHFFTYVHTLMHALTHTNKRIEKTWPVVLALVLAMTVAPISRKISFITSHIQPEFQFLYMHIHFVTMCYIHACVCACWACGCVRERDSVFLPSPQSTLALQSFRNYTRLNSCRFLGCKSLCIMQCSIMKFWWLTNLPCFLSTLTASILLHTRSSDMYMTTMGRGVKPSSSNRQPAHWKSGTEMPSEMKVEFVPSCRREFLSFV